MTSRRKGAFDLSLSFIVIVIFAVILLTLGITWLRNIMIGVGGLTDDLTKQGSAKLQETFQQSSQNFGIWPPRWDIERGKGVKMSAGIKNDAPDNHNFLINIVPMGVSDSVLNHYLSSSPTCTSFDTCSITIDGKTMLLKDYMLTWVAWVKTASVIQRSQTGFRDITIIVPTTAPTGIYQFGAVSCVTEGTTMTNAGDCTPTNLNWGGSVQPIEITVK